MRNSDFMGTQPVFKLLVKFSVPAVTGMIVQSLYNIVDRIYIGNGVGALGLAGVAVCLPLMLVILAFGMLVGIGGTAAVSIFLGEKKKDNAELVLGNSIALLFYISLVLTAAGLVFLKPLLGIMGAGEEVMEYSFQYGSVILTGAVFANLGFGINSIIRGEGNASKAMKYMISGAFLNIVLDPLFIFVLGMGVKGAAVATVISQALTTVLVLSYFNRKIGVLHFHWKNLRLNRMIVLRIVSIGMSPFAMQLAASLLNAVLNNQLNRYGGELAVSAMGIIYAVAMMIFMPVFGINQGSQPVIGYNYGAGFYGRVKSAAFYAIAAATGIMLSGFIITRFFPDLIIGLFIRDNPELAALAANGMKVFFAMLPFIGFQIVAANYFQAVGKPLTAMIMTLSRQVLFLLPMVVLLPGYFGLNGIWLAAPFSDGLSAILTGTFFIREMMQLKKKEA